MKISLFPTLKNYKKEYFGKDLTAGIMIAAVSIPISMGYATIPMNVGSIVNQGIEVDLNGVLYKNNNIEWLCTSYFIFCTFFHFSSVYFWSGCGTGGHRRSSACKSWN